MTTWEMMVSIHRRFHFWPPWVMHGSQVKPYLFRCHIHHSTNSPPPLSLQPGLHQLAVFRPRCSPYRLQWIATSFQRVNDRLSELEDRVKTVETTEHPTEESVVEHSSPGESSVGRKRRSPPELQVCGHRLYYCIVQHALAYCGVILYMLGCDRWTDVLLV